MVRAGQRRDECGKTFILPGSQKCLQRARCSQTPGASLGSVRACLFCGKATQQQLLGGKRPRPRICSPSGLCCPGKGAWLKMEDRIDTCAVPSTQNPCKRTEDPCTEEQSRAQLVWRTAGGAHRQELGVPAPLPRPLSP